MCSLWKWASSDSPRADEAMGLPSSSPLSQKPTKISTHLKMKHSAEGRGEGRNTGNSGFELYSWSPLLLLTPSINQLSKGADWERFTVAQWQLCCSEPTNHPGSFVSCLKVPLRALLRVGTRKICFTLGLSLAENGIHCCRKGMPWTHGCNRAVYKQHIQQASCPV